MSLAAYIIGFLVGAYTVVALTVGLLVIGQDSESNALIGILAVSALLLGLAAVTHNWGMERLSMSSGCEALFLFLTTVLLVAVTVGDGYDAFVTFNAVVAVITIFAIGGSSGRLVYVVIMRVYCRFGS